MTFEQIQKAEKIGIFTHINPDGDALGSTLGLMGWLDSIGKASFLFLPSSPGESLSFMIPDDHKNRIFVWEEKNRVQIMSVIEDCDLLVGLDFNTLDRIGVLGDFFRSASVKKILIDHHIAPESDAFDDVVSREDVSSTCELLYGILMRMPDIDGNANRLPELTRRSLLTGLTTDTNNFDNSVFPDTLKMVAELISAGTDRDDIIQHLFFRYPERRLRAMGHALSKKMKITKDGVGYIILDKRFLHRYGLMEGETEGFVNLPLTIADVRMSILLKEERNSKKIRVSIRSKAGTSARKCSNLYFHGGGHELAAGGKLFLEEDLASMQQAAAYIERCTHEFFINEKDKS